MINNIPTYLIGCDELSERKQITFDHLKENNVNFNYWRGLYGRNSGLMTTIVHNYWPDGRPYYISPGIASLTLNHLFLYQHCLVNNYEQVVVLEDDVHLENGWQEKMSSMLKNLPKDYDMVYLGWCHEGQGRNLKHVSDCLYNQVDGCVFGTHALLISKKGLKILIDHNRILEKPIDVQICLWSLPRMKYFVCYPSLITQKSQWKEKERIWVTSL
jgi:GR25 family glycosyltransferase involved in LPS biosynthesis